MGDRDDLKRLLFSLNALADLGQEITTGRSFRRAMRVALHVICGVLAVPKAALYAYDDGIRDLSFLAGKGYAFRSAPSLDITRGHIRSFPANEDIAADTEICASFVKKNERLLGFLEARTLLPLFARRVFVGIIILSRPLTRSDFRKSDRDLLRAAAHQCASALHNARLFRLHARQAAENRRLYETMRRIYHDTIQAFATAIDAKDQYTKHHSFRVAHYAAAIARELHWKDNDIEAIYVAGLLHDIGKLSLDVDLINKGETLTQQEQEKIKRHAEVSYEIVEKIHLPWRDVPRFIRHHHERPDGRGYPDALPSHELCEGAKILALADAYDAMTSDRPYRLRLSPDEALQEIRRCQGTQFDGRIASVLFRVLERGRTEQYSRPSLIQHTGGEMPLPLIFDMPWRADA